MQGVIYGAMKDYIVDTMGQPAWEQVLARLGRPPTHEYQLDRAYSDAEMGLLAAHAAEITGRPVNDVLEEFGVMLAASLLEVYGFLVDPRWSFLEFLLNTEAVIHAGVKLNTPGAKPPLIQALRAGPESVKISYRSRRRLCPLAKGIIHGAAAHYNVAIALVEESCMLRGDSECVITVSAQE